MATEMYQGSRKLPIEDENRRDTRHHSIIVMTIVIAEQWGKPKKLTIRENTNGADTRS